MAQQPRGPRFRAPSWMMDYASMHGMETVTAVCKKMRTSRTTLYRYLRYPETMPLGEMEKLALLLGLRLDYLAELLTTKRKPYDNRQDHGAAIAAPETRADRQEDILSAPRVADSALGNE